MSVPNQMIIQEFNYEPCDKDNIYAVINIEALRHAMQDFSNLNGLKLWLYLSKNAKGYKHLELSSAECVNNWGMGSSQFKATKESLIEKGYLVPLRQEKKTGWYAFIQNPETGKIADNENPETGIVIIDENPETGKLNDDKIPETGILVKTRGVKNPETGKFKPNEIPETGKSSMITGLINPEIIEERLQYYRDNIIIENTNEWEICGEYTLKFALDNGSSLVAEDDEWIYVITRAGKKVKFNREQNKQYVNYGELF